MCEVELDAVWRLVNEAEPSANGLHKYRQVMRFFLETRNIRYHLATAKRNKSMCLSFHIVKYTPMFSSTSVEFGL